MIIGFRGITFTLKRIGELWQEIIIINVSVARAEIACNKVLIDYGEALFHCKILKFNKKERNT